MAEVTPSPGVFDQLLKDRIIWLGSEVRDENANEIAAKLLLLAAAIYYVLLHRTNFGRRIFMIGNNVTAARFSGVRVERIKFILFCLTGLMSGIASVLLTSRLGSTRPCLPLLADPCHFMTFGCSRRLDGGTARCGEHCPVVRP